MERLYLSERNLRTLLSKVERFKEGELTRCTLIKCANPTDPYSCTMDQIAVTVVPDDKYYANRAPGKVLAVDDPGIRKG